MSKKKKFMMAAIPAVSVMVAVAHKMKKNGKKLLMRLRVKIESQ